MISCFFYTMLHNSLIVCACVPQQRTRRGHIYTHLRMRAINDLLRNVSGYLGVVKEAWDYVRTCE